MAERPATRERERERERLAPALAGLIALGPCPAALAQAAPAADPPQIVVTGFHLSYAEALTAKRASDRILETITTEGTDRFPDLNIGEAIQRLPGVQINREAESRNATIALRGLPGTFARTTINGAGFADPILSNATSTASTPLGAFNPDVFSAVTVIKSPDASDLAGGLSGTVDLRITPALSRKRGAMLKASGEYDTLGRRYSPQLTAGFNWRPGSDFAAFAVASYKEERFRRDSISVNSWANRLGAVQVGNQQKAGANPVYDALMAAFPGGVYYPSQLRQFVRDNRGEVLTASAGVEWQVSAPLRLGMTGFVTARNLSGGANQLLYIDTTAGNGTTSGLNAGSAVAHFTSLGTPYVVATANRPRAYINRFGAENLQTFDSIRSEPARQQTWAVTPRIDFEQAGLHLSLQGTVSRATVLANQIEIDLIQNPARNLGPAGLNGIVARIDTGGSDLGGFVADLTTPNATHVPASGYTIPATARAPTQAGAQMPGQTAGVVGDRFGLTGTNGHARNALDAIQIDVERSFDGGLLSTLRAGARFERNSYTSTGSRNTALGANVRAFGQALSLPSPYAADFFGGRASGATSAWRSVDVAQVLAAVTPVNTQPRSASNPDGLPGQFVADPATGVFLTPYGLINNYTDPNYWANNFTNRGDVTSLYALGRWRFAIGGIRLRGNAGLRWEMIRQTITTLDCRNCSGASASLAAPPVNHALVPGRYRSSNDYWLPSMMLVAELTGHLNLRGAYYRTYVRPQPRDNVPTTSVQTPDALGPGTDPVYTVQLGATNLAPFTASSYDLALEWYNRRGGLFSVAVFEKDVSGYIGPVTDPALLCPADGRINGVDYGLGTLRIDGANCVSSNRFTGAGGAPVNALVQASGVTNLLPLRVRGLELAVQQSFDFLPGLLRHFGGGANYTLVAIRGRDAAGQPITLPNVARHTYNLVGYFERKAFSARMTYSHRGRYDLAAGNSFVGDARSVKPRGQLDAALALRFGAATTLALDAFNLTDATRAEYESDPRLPRRLDYDGRTFRASLRADF